MLTLAATTNEVMELLPKVLNSESLPKTFVLDNVPYIKQEEMHLCGAAVVSMTRILLQEDSVSQQEIARQAGWADWRTFDHSTFREKLARYFVSEGLLFGHYYPAAFVATKSVDGLVGTTLIRRNYDQVMERDWDIFKSIIFERKSPVIVRLHFTHKQYPMPEEMLRVMDMCGHAVLLTGWDEHGFIGHDPWDKERWGGTMGGENQHIPFSYLINHPTVDCTADFSGYVDKVQAKLLVVKEAVYTNSNFVLTAEVKYPGVKGISVGNPAVRNLSIELICPPECSIIEGGNIATISQIEPGEIRTYSWRIKTSQVSASLPFSIKCEGIFKIARVPWELHSEDVESKVVSHADSRICVFEKEFLERFAKAFS